MVVRDGKRIGAPVAECQECGRERPCVWSTYKQNIALIVVYFGSEISGRFCIECSGRNFRKMTAITTVIGWPSIRSLFIGPYTVIVNIKQYLRAKKMIEAAERELRRR